MVRDFCRTQPIDKSESAEHNNITQLIAHVCVCVCAFAAQLVMSKPKDPEG